MSTSNGPDEDLGKFIVKHDSNKVAHKAIEGGSAKISFNDRDE